MATKHTHKTAVFRSSIGVDASGNLSQRQQVFAQRDLLKVAMPRMHTHLFGGTNSHAQYQGLTIRARRYLPLALDLTPLVEAENPDPAVVSYEDVEVVLRQFGRYIEHSDRLVITHEDRLKGVFTTLLARNYAETMEVLNLIELTQGTTVIRAQNVEARNLIKAPVTAIELQLADRLLSRASAEPISDVLAGSARVGTHPVPAAYYALCSSDLKPDLSSIHNWIPYEKYANGGARFVPDEMGAWNNIRLIASQYIKPERLHLAGQAARLWSSAGFANSGFISNGTIGIEGAPGETPPTSDSNADVYPILIFGKDAYVTQKLQGYDTVRIMVRQIDQPDSGDALGLKGTLGWKSYQGCMITNQDNMVRVEVACSNFRDLVPEMRIISD